MRKEGFSSQKVTTTPKLYVKFAQTDVKANEQTLVVKGFANDGKLPADKLNTQLAAPTLNQPGKDDLTPTSVKLTWNKVDGAIGYDILVDGMANFIPLGETTTFTVADLPYNSEHAFKIRTRTAEGFSDWSAEVKATTLEDPWRNCPKPVNTQWDGGEDWGKLENAFDHDDKSSNHFHSGNAATGKPMTIDYGKNYKLDKFVYTPRQDNGGNGNVSKMKIETSLDGAHWVEHKTEKWDNAGAGKTARRRSTSRARPRATCASRSRSPRAASSPQPSSLSTRSTATRATRPARSRPPAPWATRTSRISATASAARITARARPTGSPMSSSPRLTST